MPRLCKDSPVRRRGCRLAAALVALLALPRLAGAAEVLGLARISDPPPPIDGTLKRISAVASVLDWNAPEKIVFGRDRWTGPADLSGQLFLGWDTNFLYLAAQVVDDRLVQSNFGVDLWKGDHLEVFLDVPRQPAGLRDPKRVIHIGISPGNLVAGPALIQPEVVTWAPQVGPLKGARVAAVKTSEGYSLEAALPWESLGVSGVEEGLALGLDVGLSDADLPADAAQESMASLLTATWALRDPNRLVEAALGDTAGKVDPAKIKSSFTPVQQGLRVDPGTAVAADLAAVDARPVKELIVMARMDTDHIAGGSPTLQVEVNGQAMDLASVRNRLERFDMGPRRLNSFAGNAWFVFYAPDFTPAPPFTDYAVQGVNPYEFRFDVSTLWKAAGNVVRLRHSDATIKAPLVVDLGVSERLSAKLLPPQLRPAPTGEIPLIEPAPPARPAFTATQEPGGAIRVTLGAQRWLIESEFSTVTPGWAVLGEAGQGEAWKKLVRADAGLTAEAADFRVERTLHRHDDRLQVVDRITNLSAADLPVMVRHHTRLGPELKTVIIAGKVIAAPRYRTDDGMHPASLGLYAASGIGLLSEDDVLRAQAFNYRDEDTIGIDDPRLVVARGTTVELEFSVYPLETAEPFAFLNRVRQNWGVNFTLEGSFCFANQRPPVSTATDEQFLQYLEGKSAHFVCGGPGYYGSLCAHGTAVMELDNAPEAGMLARSKRLKPDTRTLYYFHCFISNKEDDKTVFAAAAHRRPDGSQADYSDPRYPLFVPRAGSTFAAMQDRLIAYRFDALGVDGIYWDELDYSAYKYDYSDLWDGLSADIDPETHRITRKIANVVLATQPWRLEAAQRILQRGPLVGNGAPNTRTFTRLHFPRFVETGSITNLTGAQLYTPIGLGDSLTEHTAVDAYRNMVEGLNYGAVYYWYFDQIKPAGPTLTAVMFPITPIELGHGYIIGKERILTNTSGRFGWGDLSSFEAVVFDDRGERTTTIAVPRLEIDGKAYAEIRIPERFSVALIRK